MATRRLAKVLNVEESGVFLPRSGVSSLGNDGTWSTCEDELASLSNPMLPDLKSALRREDIEVGLQSRWLSEMKWRRDNISKYLSSLAWQNTYIYLNMKEETIQLQNWYPLFCWTRDFIFIFIFIFYWSKNNNLYILFHSAYIYLKYI